MLGLSLPTNDVQYQNWMVLNLIFLLKWLLKKAYQIFGHIHLSWVFGCFPNPGCLSKFILTLCRMVDFWDCNLDKEDNNRSVKTV